MFRYKSVTLKENSLLLQRLVSLLERAVLKVKTSLAVLFPPYPSEMKTNTAKLNSADILALA